MTEENNQVPDQKIDMLEWPPKDWRDDFTPPKFFVLRMKNHMQGAICTLNNALPPKTPVAPSAPQMVPYHSAKELAVFFCHRTNLPVPTQSKVVMQDWMRHKISENPGVATDLLIHRSTADLINHLRMQYGNVTMKMHPVPHPSEHGVFSISEIYILHPNYENTLFDDAMQNTCLFCQTKTTCGSCKCEQVFFCSHICRDRAVEQGLHTEEECIAGMTKSLLGSMADARRILNEHTEQMKDEKKAEQLSLELALDQKSKADVVANVEAPAKAD